MDEKTEDRSEESRRNHVTYYKSLSKVISEIEREKAQETDPTVLDHLDERIDAMRRDQARIKKMFPGVEMER